MQSNNPLRGWIRKYYGNQRQLARALNVTPHTVTKWVRHRPAGILAHTLEMVKQGKGDAIRPLHMAVLEQQRELEETSQTHANG